MLRADWQKFNRFDIPVVQVPQVHVIDEVAKVPRSMRRQVPMIQEMQQDQKPEEAQISFKMYVNRGSECKERAPHLVLTSKAGRTKPKCSKTKRQSTSVKPDAKHLEREEGQTEIHDEQS